MILGVDGLRLLGRRAGVGRATEAVLRGLDDVEHPFTEIRIYTPAPLPADLGLPRGALNVVVGDSWPPGLWQQIVLPAAHGRAGLLLCPSYVVPLVSRAPTFLIHHGSYEGYPQAFPFWTRTKARWLYGLSARRATAMSTVSRHSKRDIVRYYGVDAAKVEVVPEGVDTRLFRPLDDDAAPRDWRERALGHDEPFLIYVGKPSPRRNLPALIAAFMDLKRRRAIPHRLVLAGVDLPGSPVGAAVEELGARGHVDTIGYSGHADLALAYNAADLLVYPSSYEGFGMPVLEAMACGLPAVALDNSAFPEFAGGVARLLPDALPGTLSDGIYEALTDESWRRAARERGPERAREYDWRRITLRYVELMVRTVSGPAGDRR